MNSSKVSQSYSYSLGTMPSIDDATAVTAIKSLHAHTQSQPSTHTQQAPRPQVKEGQLTLLSWSLKAKSCRQSVHTARNLTLSRVSRLTNFSIPPAEKRAGPLIHRLCKAQTILSYSPTHSVLQPHPFCPTAPPTLSYSPTHSALQPHPLCPTAPPTLSYSPTH